MTHTILILHWAGSKKRGTYREWTEPVEVEDLPICPAHHRAYRDTCADCEREQHEIMEYLARLYRTYGTTDFGNFGTQETIIRPTGYVKPAGVRAKKKSAPRKRYHDQLA